MDIARLPPEKANQNLPESQKRRFEAIVNRIPESTSSFLDIGPVRPRLHRGADLHAYLHENTSVDDLIGIDINRRGIELMQEVGYTVKIADAQDFNLDRKFEVIVAGGVLRQLPDMKGFFNSVEQHLVPGGKLILTNPNPECVVWFRRALTGYPERNHASWQTPNNLEKAITRSGVTLELEEYEYLRPIGGISSVLYRLGRKRAGSPKYIATVTSND